MKKLFFLSLVVCTVILIGCAKNKDTKLSASDQAAYNGMVTAYENARLYNDSLGSAETGIDSTRMHFCDDKYHENETDFETNHSQYNHENGHSDHNHATGGMMMSDCCNHNGKKHTSTEGHHSSQHDEMDALLEEHKKIHINN